MEWTKIKTKHFLISDLSPTLKGHLVTLFCLVAQLEKMPTERQMMRVCTRSAIDSLSSYFQLEGKSLDSVLKKILDDVEKLNSGRVANAERQKTYRNKKKNSNANVTRYITPQNKNKRRTREEYINSSNTLLDLKTKKSWFAEVWDKYPNKVGRQKAEKTYLATVKSEKDKASCLDALEIYLKHLVENTWKAPQNGSTWFNQWRDWIEFKEPEKPSSKDDEILKRLGVG